MNRETTQRYWLVHPNGGRQLIDPEHFDIECLAERAIRIGGRLVVEGDAKVSAVEPPRPVETESPRPPLRFEPPLSALGPLFRHRLDRLYRVLVPYQLEINTRATTRVLGGYYKSRPAC